MNTKNPYRSITTKTFKKLLDELPQTVQEEARKGFKMWKDDLHAVGWKKLTGMAAEVYSVEIGRRYRAIGILSKENEAVVWEFIGSHETYNKFIEKRRQMSFKNWTESVQFKPLDIRRKEKENMNTDEMHQKKFTQHLKK